jgi:hypothetical protein
MGSLVRLASASLASSARDSLFAAAFLFSGLAVAGEPAGAKKIEQWGAPEVLAEVERLESQPADIERRDALAKRATALLLEVNFQEPGEYATLRRLIKTGAPAFNSLSPEQQAQLEKLLAALAAAEDAATFEQLQARVALLNGLGKHDAAAVGAIGAWLGSRDLSSLGVEQVGWCLAESLPQRTGVNAFTVVWEGTLTAPRTGSYEFSTTPINVNRAGRDAVEHSLVAKVGDVEVLRTPQTPPIEEDDAKKARGALMPLAAEWKPVGSAVDLTANQAVPIRVELRYEAAQPSVASPPSAILCWKGPGLERQAISRNALAGPQGEPSGLRAEYRWGGNGQEQAAVEEGAVVDVVWSTPASVAAQDLKLIDRLSDRLWSLAASEEYLQRCAAGEATHVYLQSPGAVGLLTSARRQEFLELLIARPELLEKMSDGQLLSLYRGVRFGAEEAAIDLLGTWMEQRADVQPEIVADFFEKNRRVYWEMGQLLATQQPEMLDWLRDDYLVADDDRCALPVAYTLSYGYLMVDRLTPPSLEELKDPATAPKSRFEEWNELLAEKAEDKQLADSLRINWLLSRAQASEARSGPPSAENYVAGIKWVQEAQLMPEDEADFVRVHGEEIARIVAMNREALASRRLEELQSDVPTGVATQWKSQAKAVSRANQQNREATSLLTRSAYRDALTRRRDRAVARGDKESIARYDAKLGKIDQAPD